MSATVVVFYDIAAIGNLLIAVFSLIPMIICYVFYRKTRILDYLLISIFFFTWSIICGYHFFHYGFGISILNIYWPGIAGEFVISDWIYGKFLFYYIQIFDVFPLFVVAVRAKYGRILKIIPNWVKGLGLLTILLFLVALINQSQIEFNPNVPDSTLQALILCVNRTIMHAFVVYAFISCKWEETPRSKISRNIWITGSAIWVLALVYSIITVFILEWENNLDLIPFAIFIIPIDIGFALLMINNVFYPESVLFTHEQIGRALKVYPKIEENLKKQQQKQKHQNRGMKLIKQYLDAIPEEIRLEISPPQQ